MQILEEVADDLAIKALAEQDRTGNEDIVTQVGETLGSASQTLQEAYLTAVRVRRAEARARALLARFRREVPDQKGATDAPVQAPAANGAAKAAAPKAP